MSNKNIGDKYKAMIQEVHKKMAEEMTKAARQLGEKLRDETVIRTPGDRGDLKAKWALMPFEKKGDKYVISITNPAEYAAYVEFGYMQRPGMILKMKEINGKLRFVKMLGYANKYKLGDPTGKVPPDKDGFVTIVTRKRFIKGQFMAREGLRVTKEEHWPKVKAYIFKEILKTIRKAKQ